MEIVDRCRRWLEENSITDAVVGFSGGLDSCTTALLLAAAGATTHLVVAEAPGQRYASPLGGPAGAAALAVRDGFAPVRHHRLPYIFGDGAADEAALPIMRNAVFYGVAAMLRGDGRRALVAGTANFSEAAFLGFWGKASDGAQDLYPISHLSKLQVYDLARDRSAPEAVFQAPPSGDLQFSDTDDRRMIGASYPQVEAVIEAVEGGNEEALSVALRSVDNLALFADNIRRNAFKYRLPFPGFHLDSRLERFRTLHYPALIQALDRAGV